MEIISATALISINETFFIQLISFLVFMFILNRVMIRPLVSTMEERKVYLDGVSADIDKAKSDLSELSRDLDRQRSRVRQEADSAIQKLVGEGDDHANELFDSARSKITRMQQETEKKIKQQLIEARAQLSGEVNAVTTTIMEKVLHRRLQS